MSMRYKLRNIFAIQAGWYACTFGVASGRPHLGPLMVFLLALLYIASSSHATKEAVFVVLISSFGTVLDSVHLHAGTYAMDAQGLTPLVLFALWANFALAIPRSLKFLRKSTLGAAAFGFFGAPLVYSAGQRLGAITFPEHSLGALLPIAVTWMVAVPLAVWLWKRI